MVGSAQRLRQFINLIEAVGKKAAQPSWSVVQTSLLKTTVAQMRPTCPDLIDRIQRFISIKLPDPLARGANYGNNDKPFEAQSPLKGFRHCHLAKDVILCYALENRKIVLLMICQHTDIEGKRQFRTGSALSAALASV